MYSFDFADSCRVPETCRLAEALSPLLDPERDSCKDHKDELQYYCSVGVNGVCALLKVGEMERNRYVIFFLSRKCTNDFLKWCGSIYLIFFYLVMQVSHP